MKNSKYKTVFLMAMGYEIKNIFEPLGFGKISAGSPYKVWRSDDYLVVDVGVTKTCAAGGTQWAIDNIETDKWINIGLCGSFRDNFEFGEVVSVSECRFHDIDNRGLNPKWKIGQIPGDEDPVYRIDSLIEGLKVVKIISGDQFVTDKTKLKEIIDEYNPDVVDEEAAAVARIMKINGMLDKLSILKIISDKADKAAAGDFGKEERLFGKARETVQKLLG